MPLILPWLLLCLIINRVTYLPTEIESRLNFMNPWMYLGSIEDRACICRELGIQFWPWLWSLLSHSMLVRSDKFVQLLFIIDLSFNELAPSLE